MKAAVDPLEGRIRSLWQASIEKSYAPTAEVADQLDDNDDELSGIGWLMPRILRLMANLGDKPAESLRPTIHRILVEHCYCGTAGDRPHDGDEADRIDNTLDRLMAMLEQAQATSLEAQPPHR